MMDLLVFAALVMLAGFYVLAPLFRDPEKATSAEFLPETELDRLLERKSVIYRNIKDLQFEHSMGRLSDTDFHRLDADYKNDAALLLQRLDQLGASSGLDEAMEKEIAARKSKLYGSDAALSGENPRCPSCGAEIAPGKKFCADCGKRL
jgi:hypothetical protein